MSTSFKIYPKTNRIPALKEIIESTQYEFWKYFEKVDIKDRPIIKIRLLRKENDEDIEFLPEELFSWEDDSYLWVQVEGIKGGTDGYFWYAEEIDYKYWNEDIIPMPRCKPIKDLLNECIAQGHYWHFSRSVGQSALVRILYGILSGVLARMTSGIVFSDDSAWEYERMPMRGEDFLECYMIPEKELSVDAKEWSRLCIQAAKDELRASAFYQV